MVKPAQGFEMTKISPETYDVLSKYLQSYDYWSVVGMNLNYVRLRYLTNEVE